MHKLRSSSVAKLVQLLNTISTRLKGTDGRPSAPLGSRILTSPDDVFKHNMWDHIQWTEEDIENARQKAEENSSVQIPLHEQRKFDFQACEYWDKFYTMHQDKFFKDRKWLLFEFPELLPSGAKSQATNVHLPSGSSTDTETQQHQYNSPAHHQKHNSCQGLDREEDEDNRRTFPGQHASFRILEVFKSVHVHFCLLI